jgi:hypothetical protein
MSRKVRTAEQPSPAVVMAAALMRVVDSAAGHLRAVPSSEATRPRAPGKWSKKEELGHLLDSAANNHQRFIRAQQTEHLVFPAYEQETWVDLQGYQACDWAELVELWRLYNRHLARAIASIPANELSHHCTIGPNEPVTLGFLIEDYLSHLRHHLRLMGISE